MMMELTFEKFCEADPNHASPTNTTPLIKCCREWPEPREVIAALLAHGASVNHQGV